MSDITLRGVKEAPLTNDELDANFTNLNDDKLESTDLSVSTGAASGGGSLSYSAGVFTFAPADLSSYITDLSSFTTTDLTEGTNLYYTNERVDDRVNALIVPGLGITTDYNDVAGTLTIESDTIEELCKNGTASTILKGTPVYQTGTFGNFMEIAPADASSAATMPAVGVLGEDLAAGAEGTLLLMGRISGVDTSAFSEGDVIYVASGGGYTNVRPTGQSVLVQNLGRVTKVNAVNGGGVVMGSGRSNDVPNLTDGNIFIGNASGTYDKRAIVTADISDLTATATELNYTDGVTSNIQTQLDTKAPLASPTFTGTVTADGLSLGDNDKATFGASNDLEIYSDGANAIIDHTNTGAGALFIKGDNNVIITNQAGTENKAVFASNGAVSLFYDNSAKLATTATGIDVTGTATMDGLTVDGDVSIADAQTIYFSGSIGDHARINFTDSDPDTFTINFYQNGQLESGISFASDSEAAAGGKITLNTGGTPTALFADNGDISFYEDTGTTPKFFWDASAESLGIGTSSPSAKLHIEASTPILRLKATADTEDCLIHFADTSSNFAGVIAYSHNVNDMKFFTNQLERLRIDSSGNVGIGTTAPAAKLEVNAGSTGTDVNTIRMDSDSGGAYNILCSDASSSTPTWKHSTGINEDVQFIIGGNDILYLDSTNNVGMGTSSPLIGLHFAKSAGNPVYGGLDGNANEFIIRGNVYYDITNARTQPITTGYQTQINLANNNGSIKFLTSPTSVAAGSAATITERMRIDSSGNLLVGKTSADYNNATRGNVEISGSSSAILALKAGSVNDYIYNSGSNFEILAGSGQGILFQTNGSSERMRIDSSGRLLVGTTSGTEKVEVNGNIKATDLKSTRSYINRVDRTGGFTTSFLYAYSSTSTVTGNIGIESAVGSTATRYHCAFSNPNGVVGSISTNASVTSYSISSDQRLKENIADADDAGSKVDAIQVRQFDWKADGSHQDYGMVAQELAAVAPEAVTQPEDPEDMMGVDYSKLVPMLIKEIQSLRNRVATLEGN